MSRFVIFSKPKVVTFLTGFLLFAIGLKGGVALEGSLSPNLFFMLLSLMLWGFLSPFIAYAILRKVTKLDQATIVTIAACFGSVSVMTYVAAASFLDQLEVSYDGVVVTALALLEVPAIISGLMIYKFFHTSYQCSKIELLCKALCNKTLLLIFAGMGTGFLLSTLNWVPIADAFLIFFKPVLCLFLFYMGQLVGKHRSVLKEFSLSLSLFGVCMPLIGAAFGIFFSYCFHLDVGTGTLISVLTASASYIAVPAAMRMVLPTAKEAIYLPLSIGITFPFNVIVGIPLYYQVALKFLT